jgi:hypothetical protein
MGKLENGHKVLGFSCSRVHENLIQTCIARETQTNQSRSNQVTPGNAIIDSQARTTHQIQAFPEAVLNKCQMMIMSK